MMGPDSLVIARGFWPAASVIHTLSEPLRSEMNAIEPPSGEKRGCEAKSVPVTRGVASPPDAGSA